MDHDDLLEELVLPSIIEKFDEFNLRIVERPSVTDYPTSVSTADIYQELLESIAVLQMNLNDDLVEELVLPKVKKQIDELIEEYECMRLFAELHSTNNARLGVYEEILKELKELRDEI